MCGVCGVSIVYGLRSIYFMTKECTIFVAPRPGRDFCHDL